MYSTNILAHVRKEDIHKVNTEALLEVRKMTRYDLSVYQEKKLYLAAAKKE